MGFFNFKKREMKKTEEREKPEEKADDVLLKAFMNREDITREDALTLPAVNSAVDFISNSIAVMPIKLYKNKDSKIIEVDKDERVKLINGDTGDMLDGFQLKKAMVTDYLLGKGGYCYIRKSRNEVTGLFYVRDDDVSIINGTNPIYKDYQISVDSSMYKPYEFIKLLKNTRDGAQGEGAIDQVSKALETAYQTLLCQLNMVSSGGNKRGFLKAIRKLGKEEIDTLRKAWKRLYSNDNHDKSEGIIVLNNGLEFQEASATAVETQLNESKRTLGEEINAIFHIYPSDFERTYKEAIFPIVRAFETALNRDLLLEKEKKNYFFQFDTKEIVRVSIRERFEAYQMAKNTGFITLNEIRQAENMEAIEGMDVINVGLGAVLYDINKHIYYTPNTNKIGDVENPENEEEMEEGGEQGTENMVEDTLGGDGGENDEIDDMINGLENELLGE